MARSFTLAICYASEAFNRSADSAMSSNPQISSQRCLATVILRVIG
jgi:hypothetical protein